MKNINQPPKYCKNAIASKIGWIEPRTGELLISIKSLDLDLIEDEGYQVKRDELKLTMEEINDKLIDDMFPDEIVSKCKVLYIDVGKIPYDEMKEIRGVISRATTDDVSIKNEIDKEIVEQAQKIEEMHKEAGNSEIIFKDSDINVDEAFMKSLDNLEDIIDLGEMTNADIVKYAKKIGAKVSKRDNKTTLIAKIKEFNGSK